ncbi:MAG TPA: pyridoxamine 5'-phosphate oxidase, partial [Acidimicrobiaceae bacterium]|nr:pyridoxamine 5'-phosphate oxidase [Acidimicrobiaceae bacterium]
SWLAYAINAGLHNANAMAVATVNAASAPSLRTVLLRGQIDEGLVFYTNYESAKGRDLESNENAAALIGWLDLERQIRVTGPVEVTEAVISDRYFSSRPRESQISATVSRQSQPIAHREEIESAWEELDKKLGDASPPRPSHWGGYLLRPQKVEFWQGRPHRLHDRLLYTRTESGWDLSRLSP